MIFTAAKLLFGAKNFIGFLFKNWKATLVIIVVGYGYFQYRGLINQIEDLTEDNTQLLRQVEQCEDKMAEQNSKIEFWVNKGREQEAEIGKLKGKINIVRKETDKKVQEILKETKPKSCKAAIQYLIDGTGDLKW